MLDTVLKFIGLPSPGVLLGVLAALVAVAGWSYHGGYGHGFDAAEAARAAQQDKAVAALDSQLTAARADAIQLAAARAQATADADRARAGLSNALRELRNAKNTPAATCIPDDWRLRINAAVGAANQPVQPARDTGIVHFKLPTTAGPGLGPQRLGGGPD